MEPEKRKRKLQKRSIATKEKILDTAYHLFCTKGYFDTSTNEIAKAAEISIGGLYAHYPDKNMIFMEILDRYNQSFVEVLDKLSGEMPLYQSDPKAWFRRLLGDLIVLHKNSKDLNKELAILSFSKPEVTKVRKAQHEKTRQIMAHFLSNEKIELKVEDLEASSIILMGLLDVIVEQIVFGDYTISDDRILHAGIDAMLRLLAG
jgi:AcrR family transcriptional regulator